MSATGRNEPCPCGSGRKFKRCCGPKIEQPAEVASEHSAVGTRVQAWALETYPEEMKAGLAEVMGHGKEFDVEDVGAHLARTWVLSDRPLPGGETLAQRYARRPDLPARERDIAARIAAARLAVLRVAGVTPGRAIELDDLTDDRVVSVISHDLSYSVTPGDVFVGRVMAGPPASTVWGPVAFVNPSTGPKLSAVLKAKIAELDMSDQPEALAVAMRAASREVVSLFLPALTDDPALGRAAGD